MFDWLLEQSDLSEEILQHGHKRNIIHHAAKYGQVRMRYCSCKFIIRDNCTLSIELYTKYGKVLKILYIYVRNHIRLFIQDGCLRILLSKLLSDGRDLNYYDSRGDTPAHLAAKYGQLTCLQV